MSSDIIQGSTTLELFSGDLSAREFDTEYRSLKDDPVGRFYIQCLRNSSFYRRAVGYFRSTVFAVVGPAIIEFARRGGKIQLICSPDLAQADVEQIALGYTRRTETLDQSLISQFDALLSDPRTALAARTLATLIALGTLEIKLAERVDRKGIYHEKLGLFSDSLGNKLSFKGSSNETWSGWHNQGNFESIEVFCKWRGGLEAERVSRHERHFDTLWSETDPDVCVSPFPKSVDEYFRRFASQRLEELMDQAPTSISPRRVALPHQAAAITAWEERGKRGIFEHATGSGKTFTAILALRKHLAQGLPGLILVPSTLLLEQWAKELADEFPDAAMLLAGGGYNRWRLASRLRSMTAPDSSLGPRITLAMMPTASMPEFRDIVFPGEHLLLVADEVHQLGSARNSSILTLDAGARLGLSATPKRYGDPDGTAQLLAYFNGVVPPPITLQDAVQAGRLVPYEYHPHPINLTVSEAEEWLKVTRAIQLEIARQKDGTERDRPLNERSKMLLIKRSRIAKKAAAKIRLAVNVISTSYEEGHSWLVYCEDGGQLADVMIALREIGFQPIEYHSNMTGDRETTMEWFRNFGGILVSIKCLDEGVDIPAVSHALILASSQNPRQFIQRRGRVLRKSPGKHLAVIHDAIVIPVSAENEPEQISLLKAELLRSVEFAKHAINQMAGAELRSIAISMGLDPEVLTDNTGSEEDE